ncbi:MAG: alpha/beta fold hydrolase [Anaerolineaceae bacterium]|nr:MAG: alpha/beta fold hydrolase [Anaerolineaceae bacterium]
MREPSIMPYAEPFFFRGDETGCLCLHGLNASPDEMRWYGQHLAETGRTVYGVRLPGHGLRDHRAIQRTRWQDWYHAALDGYHVLRGQCERVVVCGHSMGGLLALLLGAWHDASALVVMASPLTLPNEGAMSRARWIKYARPYLNGADGSHLPDHIRAEQARRGEPVRGRVRYDIWTAQSIENLYELMRVTRRVLTAVHAPVLTLYSTADPTVPINNQRLLANRLLNARVQSHTYAHSGHILPQDIDAGQVMADSAEFITRLIASADA